MIIIIILMIMMIIILIIPYATDTWVLLCCCSELLALNAVFSVFCKNTLMEGAINNMRVSCHRHLNKRSISSCQREVHIIEYMPGMFK